MTQNKHNFAKITLADFLVRSAYQVGKTPLLPIFAATLGASDTFLGFIISVSTFTGLVLKPIIGILSDRWGRRIWLIAGTVFFAVIPFAYQFIETPTQLLVIRIIHGTATAIYGPVTLAYVAEQTPKKRAEQLGIFSMARSAGYIVGPALAGWLLLTLHPATIFTLMGFVSLVAFVPVVFLSESPRPKSAPIRQLSVWQQLRQGLKMGGQASSIWLSGGIEATIYVVLYAIKAFLPVFALGAGINVAMIGLFFALQEAVHLLLKPLGGRLGDRLGYLVTITIGGVLLGTALILMPNIHGELNLLIPAAMLGVAQALIFPATVAFVSVQVNEANLGGSMGLVGTLKNAGKVLGPVLGGLLISRFGFSLTIYILGICLIMVALIMGLYCLRPSSQKRITFQVKPTSRHK